MIKEKEKDLQVGQLTGQTHYSKVKQESQTTHKLNEKTRIFPRKKLTKPFNFSSYAENT
jgi:hypothetical protein